MTIIEDDATPPRERAPRTARPKRSARTTRRPATPPNSVSPGWAHNLLAAATLRAFQDRGGDPGLINDEFVKMIPGAEDSPEPAVLLARIYAHLAWRIPGVRAFAKRFEGKEARAGLGSDLLALAAQLYLRNQDLFAAFRDQQRAAASVEAEPRTRRGRFPFKTSGDAPDAPQDNAAPAAERKLP